MLLRRRRGWWGSWGVRERARPLESTTPVGSLSLAHVCSSHLKIKFLCSADLSGVCWAWGQGPRVWVASEEHADGGAGPGQAKGEGNPLGAESGPTMAGGRMQPGQGRGEAGATRTPSGQGRCPQGGGTGRGPTAATPGAGIAYPHGSGEGQVQTLGNWPSGPANPSLVSTEAGQMHRDPLPTPRGSRRIPLGPAPRHPWPPSSGSCPAHAHVDQVR